MFQSITVTTTTSNAKLFNAGILTTASGLLKFFETIIGATCLFLITFYTNYPGNGFSGNSEFTTFFIVTFAFLMTTFLLLISSCSNLSATLLPKTVFEFLYHLFAFIFYISTSVALLVHLCAPDYERSFVYRHGFKRYRDYYGEIRAAPILGLVNSALYLLSSIFSFRSYRLG